MWFSTAVACSSTIVGLRGQGLLHCWQSIVWKVESGPGPVSWEVCFITAEETFCFPFSKDFQHSLLQSWPLFMKKHRAQVDGDGTYKSTSLAVMFTDDRCLSWRLLGRQPTCKMFFVKSLTLCLQLHHIDAATVCSMTISNQDNL